MITLIDDGLNWSLWPLLKDLELPICPNSITKMADIEVSNDLCSNLLYQIGLIYSVNECLYCTDLNNKLKCALDKISSLNFIIKFLVNELKTDRASISLNTVPSTLCENTDNQDEHNVPIHKNWIKVTLKHSSNSRDFMNSSSLLAHQPIPTFNRYAQLINLCTPHDVAGRRPATSWVHYTTSCNTQSSAPEDG